MNNLFIDILSFSTIVSSIFVITSTNPVISVVYLILVFINAAGYLIVKGIGFIGISYIIVYIGAIAVLFLFVIMMINIKKTDILETGKEYTKNIPLALLLGSIFIYEIFTILPFTKNDINILTYLFETLTSLNGLLFSLNEISFSNIISSYSSNIVDTTFINFLQIESIGHGLYTYAAFLLIITSLILLLAMIAPIFISKNSFFQNNSHNI